jgi:hypothetical protein
MDEQLLKTLSAASKKDMAKKGRGTQIKFLEAGEIEIEKAGGSVRYPLKPLRELFAPGTDSPSVDPEDEKYMPLFLGIETEIAQYYEDENPGLTDGSVGLTLDQLAMDPNNPPASDVLAQRIAMGLRLCLSLNDYSRQEVRAALRKVRKSVERHSKVEGRRGYLDFIVEFFGKR